MAAIAMGAGWGGYQSKDSRIRDLEQRVANLTDLVRQLAALQGRRLEWDPFVLVVGEKEK